MDGREEGGRGADKINKYIDRSGVWTGETGWPHYHRNC